MKQLSTDRRRKTRTASSAISESANAKSRRKRHIDGDDEPIVTAASLQKPGFLLSQCGRIIRTKIAENIKPTGLTVPEFSVMRLLSESKSLTQIAIGARTNLDKTTVTELIDVLEAKGFASRHVSAHDRRANAVNLTASGKRSLARAEKLAAEAESQFTDLLTTREWNTVRDCLVRFIDMHQQKQ